MGFEPISPHQFELEETPEPPQTTKNLALMNGASPSARYRESPSLRSGSLALPACSHSVTGFDAGDHKQSGLGSALAPSADHPMLACDRLEEQRPAASVPEAQDEQGKEAWLHIGPVFQEVPPDPAEYNADGNELSGLPVVVIVEDPVSRKPALCTAETSGRHTTTGCHAPEIKQPRPAQDPVDEQDHTKPKLGYAGEVEDPKEAHSRAEELEHSQVFGCPEQPGRSEEPMRPKKPEGAEHSDSVHNIKLDPSDPALSSKEAAITCSNPTLHGVNDPHLSPQQQEILDTIVHGGQSLLFTGGAGTGKSVLVRAVVQELRKKYKDWGHGNKAVGVCALTGVAALHIGGQTLHSWAGVGLGNLPVEESPGGKTRDCLYRIVSRNKTARRTWMHTKVLIVDEVSMLDAILFDKLEHLGRLMRHSDEPFGGIQLVLVGDFFQLPPVVTNPTFFGPKDQAKLLKIQYQNLCASYTSRFVFDAKSWAQCVPQVVVLRHVFRQADMEFVRMLDEARRGCLSHQSIRRFHGLARPLVKDGIEPTELYPLREQVRQANLSRLKALKGESHFFHAKDYSFVHRKRRDQSESDFKQQVQVYLDKYVTAPSREELKVGAQVMLLKNLSNGLVNGSLGVIEGFEVISQGRVAFTDLGTAVFVKSSGSSAAAVECTPPSPEGPDEVRPWRRVHAGEGRNFDGDVLVAGPSDGVDLSTRDHVRAGKDHAVCSSDAQGIQDSFARPPSLPPENASCIARIDTHGSRLQPDRTFEIEIAVPSVSRKGKHQIDSVGPSLEHIEPGKSYPLVRFSTGQKILLPCLEFEVQSPVGDKEALRVQVCPI